MEHTIDATNKKIGRLATEVAQLLCGKDKTSFAKNLIPKTKVLVTNASKLSITENKLKGKEHEMYSGYPGGLKFRTTEKTIEKKGYAQVVKQAVSGMLPKNKLRAKMLLNLKVTE